MPGNGRIDAEALDVTSAVIRAATIASAVLLSLWLCGCDARLSAAERVARATAALARGDPGAAVVDLKMALQKDPSDARARLLLAKVEFGRGELAAASSDLDKVDASRVTAGDYQSLVWRVRLAERRFADAIAGLEAPRAGLSESDRVILLARAYVGVGRLDDARALLEQAVRAEPDNDEALATLGRVVAAKEGPAAALEPLSSGATRFPRSLSVQRALGDTLLAAGRFPEAEVASRGAFLLTKPGEDLPAYLGVAETLADSLLAQGRVPELSRLSQDVAKVAPRSVFSVMLRARVAVATRDYPTALDNFRKLLAIHPDDARLLTAIAAIHLEQGKVEQAADGLQQVVAAHPEFLNARRLLAETLLRQGRPQEATRLLDDVQAAEASPEIQLLRARAALASADKGTAEAILAELGAKGGESEQRRLDIAALYLQAGEPERAQRLLNGAGAATAGRREQLGLIALASTDRPAGVRALVDYAAKNSGRRSELQFAALTLAAVGEAGRAVDMLDQYTKVHPEDGEMRLSLARVQARAGKLEDADASMRRALEIKPSTEIRIDLARLAAMRGREEEAIRWLEQARSADARAVPPRALLVRAYLAQRRADVAKKVVDELLAIDRSGADSHLLAAAVAVALGDSRAAQQYAEDAVRAVPRSAEAWLAKGQVLFQARQIDAARAALRQAVALDPRSAAALTALAQLELAAGDRAAAHAVAAAATARDESRAAGLRLEGELLLQEPGKSAEAVRVYERLQAVRPSSLGAIQLYQARASAGVAHPEQTLDEWLRQHPRDIGAYAALAGHWQQHAEPDRAIAAYQAALAIQPNSAGLLNNLACVYLVRKDPRALATARRAYELAPHAPQVADTLGWTLVEQGSLPEGLNLLREAAAGAPNETEVQYHLAAALARGGDKAGAKAIADRITAAGTTPEWQEKFAALVRN